MKEFYIRQKVVDMFHMKRKKDSLARIESQAKVSHIMNIIHAEIALANQELERRIVRKLEFILKEQL